MCGFYEFIALLMLWPKLDKRCAGLCTGTETIAPSGKLAICRSRKLPMPPRQANEHQEQTNYTGLSRLLWKDLPCSLSTEFTGIFLFLTGATDWGVVVGLLACYYALTYHEDF